MPNINMSIVGIIFVLLFATSNCIVILRRNILYTIAGPTITAVTTEGVSSRVVYPFDLYYSSGFFRDNTLLEYMFFIDGGRLYTCTPDTITMSKPSTLLFLSIQTDGSDPPVKKIVVTSSDIASMTNTYVCSTSGYKTMEFVFTKVINAAGPDAIAILQTNNLQSYIIHNVNNQEASTIVTGNVNSVSLSTETFSGSYTPSPHSDIYVQAEYTIAQSVLDTSLLSPLCGIPLIYGSAQNKRGYLYERCDIYLDTTNITSTYEIIAEEECFNNMYNLIRAYLPNTVIITTYINNEVEYTKTMKVYR